MPERSTKKQVAIIGGGAAGFFCAINLAAKRPDIAVHIFEKNTELLGKVKVSGGGRCNVTHQCFDPSELSTFYPRGGRELLGPFHRFQPADTIEWFAERGVEIQAEADGRMFPVTNTSQTIIDCFLREASIHKVHIHTGHGLQSISRNAEQWSLTFSNGRQFSANALMIAAGSSQHIWKMITGLSHHIEPPVPSLFTFHIQDARINGLMGVSIPHASVMLDDSQLETSGPLLITHWGMSGPAILKLSAWGARLMAERQYRFGIRVNFTGTMDTEAFIEWIRAQRTQQPRKHVFNTTPEGIPTRLWKQLCAYCAIAEQLNWADLSKQEAETLALTVTASQFRVKGKSTFKEEFVTCGGVRLAEVDMRTMESKLCQRLYFAGEVLDIDAVTGGFNFQAAWTTAFLAASDMAVKL